MARHLDTHTHQGTYHTRISRLQGHSHLAKRFLSFFGLEASFCSLFPEKQDRVTERLFPPPDVLLSLKRKGTWSNVFSTVKNAASFPQSGRLGSVRYLRRQMCQNSVKR